MQSGEFRVNFVATDAWHRVNRAPLAGAVMSDLRQHLSDEHLTLVRSLGSVLDMIPLVIGFVLSSKENFDETRQVLRLLFLVTRPPSTLVCTHT